MFISVDRYNAAEAVAAKSLPNRVIEASGATLFSQVGYPYRAADDNSLWRFTDAMHELGERNSIENLCGGLTEEEFELVKSISTDVLALSSRNFGVKILPKGSLSRAIVAFRLIRALQPSPAVILEIGSGSGYLGALLVKSGYTYIGTDIAQGFYLYQSLLWHELFDSNFRELADEDTTLSDLGALPSGTIVHVPWWKFYGANPDTISLHVDLVTSNHALCEMNRSALGFSSAIGRDLLRSHTTPKYFVCEGPGAGSLRSRGEMQALLAFTGLTHVYSSGEVDIFSPSEYEDQLWLSLSNGNASNSAHDDHGEGSRFNPTEIVRILKKALRLISQPGGIKSLFNRARSYLFGTPLTQLEPDLPRDLEVPQPVSYEIKLPLSASGLAIQEAFASIESEKRFLMADLEEFRKELVGEDNFQNPDEIFMMYSYASDDW
jgi:SAM-dependent methyltransferase